MVAISFPFISMHGKLLAGQRWPKSPLGLLHMYFQFLVLFPPEIVGFQWYNGEWGDSTVPIRLGHCPNKFLWR